MGTQKEKEVISIKEPEYPIIYDCCLKYHKKDELIEIINKLYEAINYYKNELKVLNGNK